ncbi:MAG: hypothetical protein QM758_22980 [Armatimonas sp.]
MNTRFLAGGLTTLWAGFWGYFATMALLFEPGETPTRVKVAAFVVALLGSFLWSAWTRKRAGGVWLCIVGAGLTVANIVFFRNPPATQGFLFAVLAAPPLAAGLMTFNPARRANRADVAAVRK